MKYSDKYKNCNFCPVKKYCGTMVSSTRLCNSYEPTLEEVEKSNKDFNTSKVADTTTLNK